MRVTAKKGNNNTLVIVSKLGRLPTISELLQMIKVLLNQAIKYIRIISYFKKSSPCRFYDRGCRIDQFLEYTFDLAGLDVNVNSSECRVRAGSGHKADRTCYWYDKSSAAVCEDLPDLEFPSCWDTF